MGECLGSRKVLRDSNRVIQIAARLISEAQFDLILLVLAAKAGRFVGNLLLLQDVLFTLQHGLTDEAQLREGRRSCGRSL